MSDDNLPSILAGEPHNTPRDIPQRLAGGTFPGEDLTEAVAARGERHIELDGGAR